MKKYKDLQAVSDARDRFVGSFFFVLVLCLMLMGGGKKRRGGKKKQKERSRMKTEKEKKSEEEIKMAKHLISSFCLLGSGSVMYLNRNVFRELQILQNDLHEATQATMGM